MPKHGIHKIILDETTEKLKNGIDPGGQEAADIIEKELFHAGLGAIGPDLFFFAEDYWIMGEVEPAIGVIRLYHDIKREVEAHLEDVDKVYKRVEKEVDTVLNAVGVKDICDKLEERADSLEDLIASITSKSILAGTLQIANPIETDSNLDASPMSSFTKTVREIFENFFTPPVEANMEEKEWYWMDMLHYRSSGEFCKNLMDNADTAAKKAYALGYITHIAADVTGHSYVNQISGTSFRMGVQRHAVIEHFHGSYAYKELGKDINSSLATDFMMSDGAHRELPDDIAELLAKSFEDTYSDEVHPQRLPANDGFLSKDQIKNAYVWARLAIKMSGESEIKKPEPPTPTVEEDLADIMSAINALDPPPAAPDFTPDFSDMGQDTFSSWMAYAAEYIQYAIETLKKLARLLREIVKAAANMVGSVALAVMYGIECILYDILKELKHIIALNGFCYPDGDELNGALAQQLIYVDPNQKNSQYVYYPEDKGESFPWMRKPGQSQLTHPDYAVEGKPSIPGMHPAAVTNADRASPADFIRNTPFKFDVLRNYSQARSPDETRELQNLEHTRSGPVQNIGNAVDFSAWMIRSAMNPSLTDGDKKLLWTNWNLDADRGHGGKSWAGIVPHNADPSEMAKLCLVVAKDMQLNSDPRSSDNPVNLSDFADSNQIIDIPSWTIKPASENASDLNDYLNFIRRGVSSFPSTSDASDSLIFKTKVKHERYVEKRSDHDLEMANLTISEFSIPSQFSMNRERSSAEWQTLLAPRVAADGNGYRDNVYYINGICTKAYDAIYEAFAVEYFLTKNVRDNVRVRLLHNYSDVALQIPVGPVYNVITSTEELNLAAVSDMYQAVEDKLWSYLTVARALGVNKWQDVMAYLTAPDLNRLGFTNTPKICNSATIAVIALLSDAIERDAELGFVSHSQGSQITFNGILAFALQGDRQRQFLSQKVKVMFTGPMVDELSINLLKLLLGDSASRNSYYALINDNDPIAQLIGGRNVSPVVGDIHALCETLFNMSITNGWLEAVKVESAKLAVDVSKLVTGTEFQEHMTYLYFPMIKNGFRSSDLGPVGNSLQDFF